MEEVPVWVRIRSLPPHLWSMDVFHSIDNKLGIYLDADMSFQVTEMRTFAYILVKLDLREGFSHLILNFRGSKFNQQVDYEDLPFRCRLCHSLGHFVRDDPLATKGYRRSISQVDSRGKQNQGFIQNVVSMEGPEDSKASQENGGGQGSSQGAGANSEQLRSLEESAPLTALAPSFLDSLESSSFCSFSFTNAVSVICSENSPSGFAHVPVCSPSPVTLSLLGLNDSTIISASLMCLLSSNFNLLVTSPYHNPPYNLGHRTPKDSSMDVFGGLGPFPILNKDRKIKGRKSLISKA